MATFTNFAPLVEGDPIDASTLNGQFTDLADVGSGLNALAASSVEREALSEDHLPALSAVDIFSNGYTAIAPSTASGTLDVYDNRLPLSAGDTTFPYTYQTFHANAAVTNPYGPSTVAGDLGWAIVAYSGVVADAAEVSFNAADMISDMNLFGILVRGSLEFRAWDSVETGTGVNSVAIAIGYEDGAGARFVIERSVRFYSMKASAYGDLVTSTLITQDDLTGVGDDQISSVFLVVAGVEPTGGAVAKNARNITTSYYNLTTLPIHASTLKLP